MANQLTPLEEAFIKLESDEKINFVVKQGFRMERIEEEKKKEIFKNEIMRYGGKYRVLILGSKRA